MKNLNFLSLRKASLLLALFAVVSVSFVSCKDDDDDDDAPAAAVARLMVTHASPDAPGVDLLVDDVKVNTSALTFPNSTAYLNVIAGTRDIKVNVAGTSTNVLNADLVFAANKNYSLFAIDSVSNLGAVFFEDDLTAPAAGKAHVRFIHLSPNAPAVDIAVTGGPVVFPGFEFIEGSAFTPLDAGTYNLEVRLAGTTTVVLPLPGIALEAGKIYTVFAKGFVGGTGAQALGAQIILNN